MQYLAMTEYPQQEGYKAISGEEYTQIAGLFVHFLRCKNSCIARYAPIFTP
jgi:hypothetical protein